MQAACRNCGHDIQVGERFCAPCRTQLLSSSRTRQRRILAENRSPLGSSHIFKAAVFGLPACFILILLVTFFCDQFHRLALATMFALVVTELLASLGAWAVMWMELFVADFTIALAACLLPIGVYSVVIQNPERTKKPFFMHAVCSLLLAVTALSFQPVTGTSLTELMSDMFTPVQKEAGPGFYRDGYVDYSQQKTGVRKILRLDSGSPS